MKKQLEFLYPNIVWVPIEAPKWIKPIGLSLVYKKNTRVDGKLEFYVAKTMANGYSLKLCFNYGKPFQQWPYSNPSNYSYLLHRVLFMRYNNNKFSQQSTLCA